MMRKLLTAVFAGAIIGATSFADSDSILDAFKNGTFGAEVGVVYHGLDISNDYYGIDIDEQMFFGFVSLSFVTDAYCGLTLGTRLVGVGELVTQDDMLYEARFMNNAALAEAWASYAIPNTESSVSIGRMPIVKSPIIDGDMHEGIQIVIGDIPCTQLALQAITGFAAHLSTAIDGDGIRSFDDDLFQGVGDWDSEYGDVVFAGIADITVIQDTLSVAPFCAYQDGLALVMGVDAGARVAANEELTIVGDFTGAICQEDTPWADEDFETFIVRGGAEWRQYSGGIGYYYCSDDMGPFDFNSDGVVPLKALQPTEIFGDYGGGFSENTWLFDAGWQGERVGVDVLYANGDLDMYGVDISELNIHINVLLVDDVTMSAYYARGVADFGGSDEDVIQEVGIGVKVTR